MAKAKGYEGQLLQKRGYGSVIATAIAIVLVLGGFGVWQARPLYHWMQSRRAISQVSEIDRLVAAEKWPDAFQLMQDLYRMAPDEPEILRAAARLSMAKKSPEARHFYSKLIELGEASYEDRRDLVKVYIGTGDLDRAEQLIEELLQVNRDDVIVLGHKADVLLAQKDFRAAMNSLTHLLKLDPRNDQRRLLLAQLLINFGVAEEKNTGWEYVFRVAANKGELGIKALDLLMLAEGLPVRAEEVVISLIDAHPLVEERHRVEALRRSVRIYPERRDEIISGALEERSDWDAHNLNVFFRWLSQEGEYAAILEHVSLEKARESGDLIPVFLNALGHSGDWEKVRTMLDESELPLSETSRKIFSALCSSRLKEDPAVVERYLREAIGTVKEHGSYMEAYRAGAFAEANGIDGFAEMAYELAQRSADCSDLAFGGLIRLAEKSGDAARLRKTAQRYHWRFPNRSELEERYLYLNALLGFEIETTLQEAMELLEKEPFRIPPRIIAGLAFYRMNNISRAMEACSEYMAPEEMSPGERTVYAAILGAADRTQLAGTISKMIATDDLLKEERELIAPLRAVLDGVEKKG